MAAGKVSDGGVVLSRLSKAYGRIRRLQGEHVIFTFEQHGPSTEVRVTGKLRSRAHAEVTEALGGY